MNSTTSDPIWFKRWGWFYLPVHPCGYAAAGVAFAFIGAIFVMLDEHAHSVTDLLCHLYTFAAPTFLGLMWLGSRTSDEKGGRA